MILIDDGNGNLTAKTIGTDDEHAFAFTNTFSASASIPAITGSKTLKNAPSNDESTYSFRLSPSDDATAEAVDNGYLSFTDGGKYQDVSCKAGEKFAFDEMVVTRPGTYTLKVSENIPTDDKKVPGVEYDKTEYTISYTVSANGTSKMDVTPSGKNPSECDFENVYKAAGSVTLKALKTIDGKALEDGEFEFELRDSNGNVISTARNDASGSVTFDDIEYNIDDAGKEHRYTIREKVGNELGVTYDDKVISVDVKVSDNGDGTLSANTSYDGAGSEETFHNAYQPPTVSDVMSDLVQTGIESIRYVIIGAICIIPIIAIVRRRMRK